MRRSGDFPHLSGIRLRWGFGGRDAGQACGAGMRATVVHLPAGWQLISVWVIVFLSRGDGGFPEGIQHRRELRHKQIYRNKHQRPLEDVCPEVCFFTQKWAVFKIGQLSDKSLLISVYLHLPNCLPFPPNLFCSLRHLSSLIHWWMEGFSPHAEQPPGIHNPNPQQKRLSWRIPDWRDRSHSDSWHEKTSLSLRPVAGCTSSSPPLSDSFISPFFGDHSNQRETDSIGWLNERCYARDEEQSWLSPTYHSMLHDRGIWRNVRTRARTEHMHGQARFRSCIYGAAFWWPR